MAKYCVKCGRPLPDGEEFCPICNQDAENSDAALFTRITAETEIWKESENGKKQERAMSETGKRRLLICAGAVLLALVVAFVIVFTLPMSRATRALNAGEYDKAVEIFQTSCAGKTEFPAHFNKALAAAGGRISAAYAANEITAKEAESSFSALYSLGAGAADLLRPSYTEYVTYSQSHSFMTDADALFEAEDYLRAHEIYLQVLPDDADYAAAQEKAQLCLDAFAAACMKEADAFLEEDKFEEAIGKLQEGDLALLDYNTFSADIDAKLESTYSAYEIYILESAAELADLEDYDAAIRTVRSCTDEFGYHTDRLDEELERYEDLLRAQKIADAGARADACYDAKDYTGAFAELDEMKKSLDGSTEAVDALISGMEQRYTDDMLAAAEETFAGARENLTDAINLLTSAAAIRPLTALTDRASLYAEYLPAYLAEMEYAERDGNVFRNDTSFEGLDGATYKKGWIWGSDGAFITYDLEGNYNRLEGVFADRRDDDFACSARYDVWCDGTPVYESERMHHYMTDGIPLSLDVTGVKELRIIFFCDYESNSAEDGYCYHGLCDVALTKDLSGLLPEAKVSVVD